ncbi:MAG: ribonuclease H [Nitrosopumilaceae archaeon]|nr:ribonuclease H [Nitrosopumilaceae archaeon]
MEIWTDGGKNKEMASWGFCYYSPQLEKIIYEKYGTLTGTSQEGELSAALKALEFLVERYNKNLDNIQVILYSDSQYLVKGINEWLWGWKNRSWKGSSNKTIKNLEYWQTLDKLKTQIPHIKFKWVRGHSGVELNEYVDGLCQKAIKEARQHEESRRNNS